MHSMFFAQVLAQVDLLQITFGANDCEILRGILESHLVSIFRD